MVHDSTYLFFRFYDWLTMSHLVPQSLPQKRTSRQGYRNRCNLIVRCKNKSMIKQQLKLHCTRQQFKFMNQFSDLPKSETFDYRISLYKFCKNYSFSNLGILRSQYIRPKVTVHVRELFKGGNYLRKYIHYL